MRARPTVLVLALAACGGGAKPTASPAGPKLCLDITMIPDVWLARTAMQILPDEEQALYRAALGLQDDATVGPVWTQGEKPAVVWTACAADACDGGVALYEMRGDAVVVQARAPLPGLARAFGGEGLLDVTSASIGDEDGDGQPELWVYYDVPGKPAPGVGADVEEDLAIFNVPELSLAFHATIGITPAASSGLACEGVVTAVDVDCNRRQDLVVGSRCITRACQGGGDKPPECAGERAITTRIAWLRRGDRFVEGPKQVK